VLTLAQLLGNLSRAGFGWREIRWKPALLFSIGAVPACLLGARFFVVLPSTIVLRSIGLFLLLIVVLRHSKLGRRAIAPRWLAPAGFVVGLLSSIVGSAGPLGALVFLGLRLPPHAYVASEAVTAVAMHLTKTLVYGRYALVGFDDLVRGIVLGSAMIVGSWTGRKLLDVLPEHAFEVMVEGLLVIAAIPLLIAKL
jgi:uncharacterized membrane protein YfcA